MILATAAIVVLVLFVVALLPSRKRDGEPRTTFNPAILSAPQPVNLRQQQLREESAAIADQYQRLAEEAWLQEVRVKATALLSPGTPSATQTLDE